MEMEIQLCKKNGQTEFNEKIKIKDFKNRPKIALCLEKKVQLKILL